MEEEKTKKNDYIGNAGLKYNWAPSISSDDIYPEAVKASIGS